MNIHYNEYKAKKNIFQLPHKFHIIVNVYLLFVFYFGISEKIKTRINRDLQYM